MNNPMVDIVMATYNGSSFVAEQIESILAQSYKNIRLLVRDDLSGDSTLKIVRQYATRQPEIILDSTVQDAKAMQDFDVESRMMGANHFQMVKAAPIISDYVSKDCVDLTSSTAEFRIIQIIDSKERLGVVGNFSQLLEHTRAPYVMLSDQDDVWDRDKVKKTLKKMCELEQKHGPEKPILVHTDLRVVNRNLDPIAPSFWKYTQINGSKTKSLNRLLGQPTVTGCTVMVNQSLLKLALPIPKQCIMHDYWLSLVAAAFGIVEPLSETTLSYRQHEHNSLGAKKFTYLEHFKKAFRRVVEKESFRRAGESERRKQKQASLFLDRYQNRLGKRENEVVTAFIKLGNSSPLVKYRLASKYNLWRDGLIRNIGLLVTNTR